MIPELMVQAWKNAHAPWSSDTMVEQDLVLSRALVELYNHPVISSSLVFRGGTALNKIYIQPPSRYSEDLDFVQIRAEPIGDVMNAIRQVLDSWLGEPRRKMTERSAKLIYRYQSSENIPAKLKIEINTTEHFHLLNLAEIDFTVASSWFNGNTKIITYELNELMGTKLRALYQRKKGRDLFDIWYVLHNNLIDIDTVINIFHKHCNRTQDKITRAMFEKSLYEKRDDINFRNEMNNLITTNLAYDFDQAFELIMNQLLPKLEGEKWKMLDNI